MQIDINGLQINYDRHLGDKAVILMHGFNLSKQAMQPVYDHLSKRGLDVINLDLPAFGLSTPPPPTFTIFDYAETIKQFIQKLNLTDVTLIGHSFGGRIAILLGKEDFVKKVILVSSAGIKPKFSLKKAIRIRRYKRAKAKGRDLTKFGSPDYKSLNKDMQRVFVSVVNTHLNENVKQIKKPVLLVWGDKDNQTPLYMAKKIKNNLNDCGLVVLEGGHFVYLERINEFNAIISSFILGE